MCAKSEVDYILHWNYQFVKTIIVDCLYVYTVITAQNFNEILTRNKTTWAVEDEPYYAGPYIAVDCDPATCYTTINHPHAWWAVDLGQDLEIQWFGVRYTANTPSRSNNTFTCRDHSVHVPIQRGTLHCKVVSHWLGSYKNNLCTWLQFTHHSLKSYPNGDWRCTSILPFASLVFLDKTVNLPVMLWQVPAIVNTFHTWKLIRFLWWNGAALCIWQMGIRHQTFPQGYWDWIHNCWQLCEYAAASGGNGRVTSNKPWLSGRL